MRGRRWLASVALACLAMSPPAPHTFGRVVLDGFSRRARVPPVGFDHWRHRVLFTCRLCHVDVGFAMSAGETGISASTNRAGFHCGACHNGRTVVRGRAVFAACSASGNVDESPSCRRCHAQADPAAVRAAFEAFASKMPRASDGGVDWNRAEALGRVAPVDEVEGVSIRRAPLRMDKEIAFEPKATWMSGVLFSHRKHALWNGCEVCHPDIYPRTESGGARYTMLQIFGGASCGACHDKVAFPFADCSRCHLGPVQAQ